MQLPQYIPAAPAARMLMFKATTPLDEPAPTQTRAGGEAF
jgi:hypothetical protein